MSFVELPSSVQLAVISTVSALVAIAITYLVAYAPWLSWIENYKEQVGAAVGLAVLEALQNALPGQYPEASILAVELVIALIAIYTGVKTFLIERGSTRLR